VSRVWANFGHGNVAGIGEHGAGQQTNSPAFERIRTGYGPIGCLRYAKQPRHSVFMALHRPLPGETNMISSGFGMARSICLVDFYR